MYHELSLLGYCVLFVFNTIGCYAPRMLKRSGLVQIVVSCMVGCFIVVQWYVHGGLSCELVTQLLATDA